MVNIIKSLGWMIVLTFFLMLPTFIPIGSQSLMDWQIETLHWNYIGVSANYILFFIFLWYSKKPKEYFGLHLGNMKDHLLWFCVLTIIVITFMRIMAYLLEGPLFFQVPMFTTFLFQFLFVALGEELFWRGTIQTEYGIWIASIGFGLLHFVPELILNTLLGSSFNVIGGLAHFVFATVLGFILGCVRIKTDSIFACALLHGLYGLSNHMLITTNI